MTGRRAPVRRRPLALAAAVALLVAGCRATPILGVRPAPAGGGGPATVVLLDGATSVRRGDRVLLATPAAPVFEGVVDIVRHDRDGRLVLTGRIDRGGPFLVADRPGGLRGIVDGPDDDLEFVPAEDRAATVVQRTFPPMGACRVPRHRGAQARRTGGRPADPGGSATTPPEDEPGTPESPAAPQATDPQDAEPGHAPERELRVLLVFAGGSLDELGGDAWAVAHARDCVHNLELALKMTGIPHAATLVRAVVVDEPGSGDLARDLDRLVCWRDGHWDGVHPWRDAVHADVVALVVADGGTLQGIAQQFRAADLPGGSRGFAQRGFLVLTGRALAGATVFVHEVGHVLGCGHNRDSEAYETTARVIPSGHAYIDFGARFSTLMCVPSTRAPRGSSYPQWFQYSTVDPSITHNGVVTGCAGSAEDPLSGCDNASAIRLTWDLIAGLRRDACADGTDLTYDEGCPVCAGSDDAHTDPPAPSPLPADLLDAPPEPDPVPAPEAAPAANT